MKILILNKYYHPKIGGIETVVRQHARHLVKRGHSVDILVCNEEPKKKSKTYLDQDISVTKSKTLFEKFSMPVSTEFFFKLFKRAKNYDLIYLHEPFPAGTLGMLFMPNLWKILAVYYHSDIVKKGFLGAIFTMLQKLILKRSKLIMTSSPKLVEFSKVLEGGKRTKVVPIWVDEKDKKELSEEIKHKERDYYLFIGRNSYYKGINIIAGAAKIYHSKGGPKKILLAGDDFSEHTIGSSDKIITINNHVSEAKKDALIKYARALLFPSTEVSEAYGIVQVEAMSFGVPVINTSIKSGVPWVSLDGISGITTPPGDESALADAMLKLDKDETRNRLGEGAKQRFKEKLSEGVNSRLFTSTIEST